MDDLERFRDLDVVRLGDTLFELAADAHGVTAPHRKQLYVLAQRFKELARTLAADGSEPRSGKMLRLDDSKGRPVARPVPSAKEAGRKPASVGKVVMPPKLQQAAVVANAPVAVAKTPVAVAKAPVAVAKAPVAVAKTPVAVAKTPVAVVAPGQPAASKGKEAKSAAPAKTQANRRESGASEFSTSSQKSVRFSHADVVGLKKITRQMKETPKLSSKDMGKPEKGLLKR
jgi:hypothetical protein